MNHTSTRVHHLLTALAWLLCAPGEEVHGQLPSKAASDAGTNKPVLARRGDLVFVENVGQWDEDVSFVAQRGTAAIVLRRESIDIVERGTGPGFLLRLRFESSGDPQLLGEERVATRYSYFLGSDAKRWRSSVPAYRSVLYRGIADGIDLRLRDGNGAFEYELMLAPSADLDAFSIACEGADALGVDDHGRLVTTIGPYVVHQSLPRTWITASSGAPVEAATRYTVGTDRRFGFVTESESPTQAPIVSSGIEWSTFLGGAESLATEAIYAVELGDDGSVMLGGLTTATDFPTTPGTFDVTYNGGLPQIPSDGFAAQLDADGASLVFATYLGGTGNEQVRSLSLAGGRLCLMGRTSSLNLPLTANAIDTSASFNEAFVTCLDEAGTRLLFSSYLGGSSSEGPGGDYQAPGGAIDERGVVTLAGSTQSRDFPTTSDALSTRFLGGSSDVFLSQIDVVRGAVVYSTYLGGSGSEHALDVWIQDGLVAMTGPTSSPDFTVTANAFATTKNPSNDAFVMVFDTEKKEIVYSSFLGGSQSDDGHAIHLDENGVATVAGQVQFGIIGESDFPVTPGAFQTTDFGLSTGFVTRMDTNDGSLLYSTFLAGDFFNDPMDLDVQSSGAVTVVGRTTAGSFPTTLGAIKTTNIPSVADAFVTRLRPDGSDLIYSTYLGGPGTEFEVSFFAALALDPTGAAVVASESGSPDFPTTPGTFQPEKAGIMDITVAKLTMLPAGVERIGASTPGCRGPLAASVWSGPFPEATDFAIECLDAPPLNTRGLLLLSLGAAPEPVTVKGIDLWIEPSQLLFAVPVKSNELGHSVLPTRVPDDPRAAGVTVYAQYVWWDPCGPAGWSSSPALGITIQQ